MSDKGRTSLSLYGEREYLEKVDKSNSEYVRELIKQDQQYNNAEEVRDFKIQRLESEIEELWREGMNRVEEGIEKIQHAEELEEQLEQLKNNDLLPQNREAIEEWLEKADGEGGQYLNIACYWVKDCAESCPLSKQAFVKEAVKHAESLPELDYYVEKYRNDAANLSQDDIRVKSFDAGGRTNVRMDAGFLMELVEIRSEALPEDWDGRETEETGLKSVGSS